MDARECVRVCGILCFAHAQNQTPRNFSQKTHITITTHQMRERQEVQFEFHSPADSAIKKAREREIEKNHITIISFGAHFSVLFKRGENTQLIDL